MKLVFSCEHGGNTIPQAYQHLFLNATAALNSHRGIDYGSLDLYNFCRPLSDFSRFNTVSRLLIELNRSKHHSNLFSEFTTSLNEQDKSRLITGIYDAYRNEIENEILKFIRAGLKVLHISFHSFTPILNNEIRNADIGILYDPSRNSEKIISSKLKQNLAADLSDFNIRFNYPYLGNADGFTTFLRKKFHKNYNGIELEINQKFINKENEFLEKLKKAIFHAIWNLK